MLFIIHWYQKKPANEVLPHLGHFKWAIFLTKTNFEDLKLKAFNLHLIIKNHYKH